LKRQELKMASKFTSNTVSILGVGYRGGQPKGGVEMGPDTIRNAGLVRELAELGWTVEDKGNVAFDSVDPEQDAPCAGTKHPRQVGGANKKIFNVGKQEVEKKHAVLNLGGDHSLAIGTISASGSVYPDLRVIWVDAHADINLPETSPTGNIHGMPVAFVMGLTDAHKIAGFEWVTKCLSPDRIVYVGLRGVDQGEKDLLKKHGIKAFSMIEVDKYGIGEVMKMALDHICPNRDKPIHLSFDVDGIDPSEVPSTGTTVKGGLTYREARYLCHAVAETGCLVAMDIAEVNPSLGSPDDVKKTSNVAVDLAKYAFGQRLL